jgi:cation:H+ antiporter
MDIALNLVWIILGLGGLYYGAEWLVRGAAGMALMAGLSSLVVGLTVVAFGTSMPELIVSIRANLQGDADIALGNVVGSNICNIGLVLGIAALITPITLHRQFLRRELPILIVVSIVFVAALLHDQTISQIEGFVFGFAIIAYTALCIRIARSNPDDPIAAIEDEIPADVDSVEEAEAGNARKIAVMLFWLVAGLAFLLIGADRLVAGSKFIAESLGVSKAVIALTVVAFGTSLPELATTIVACAKGESDLAAGNAIGSCLFNLLCVVGFTAIIKPIVSMDISAVDLSVMVAFAFALPIMMWKDRTLGRIGGAILLIGYLVYICWTGVPG